MRDLEQQLNQLKKETEPGVSTAQDNPKGAMALQKKHLLDKNLSHIRALTTGKKETVEVRAFSGNKH